MRTQAKQPTQIDTASFVRAVLDRNRRPNAQLEDLVIHYNCYDSIGRLDPSDELVRWTATLELSSDDEEGGTAEPAVVATATYFAFDILDSRWDPNDVLDAHSADTAVYRNLFYSEGNLLDELNLGGAVRDSSSWTACPSIEIGAAGGSVPSLRHEPFAISAAMTRSPPATRHPSSSRSTTGTGTRNGFASAASGNTWASVTTGTASSSAIPAPANPTMRSTN